MNRPNPTTALENFTALRPRLFGIAYRMLGSFADAEDIVQETYVRLHSSDSSNILNFEAWLVSVATRLSIDKLRSAQKQRESYIGEWLAEPVAPSDLGQIENRSDLSLAFLYILERLSPTERAAFILREVFDRDYAEIAEIIGKSDVFTRQIVSRAKKFVRSENKRFDSSEQKKRKLLNRFIRSATSGDLTGLIEVFSDDIRLISDGGGIVKAAVKIVTGRRRIARLYSIQGKKSFIGLEPEIINANGSPALLITDNGKPFSLISVEVEGDKIVQLNNMMNPEKLTRLAK